MSEINLGVTSIECPANDDGEALEEVMIESGQTLTITTTRDYVRYASASFPRVIRGKALRHLLYAMLPTYSEFMSYITMVHVRPTIVAVGF